MAFLTVMFTGRVNNDSTISALKLRILNGLTTVDGIGLRPPANAIVRAIMIASTAAIATMG